MIPGRSYICFVDSTTEEHGFSLARKAIIQYRLSNQIMYGEWVKDLVNCRPFSIRACIISVEIIFSNRKHIFFNYCADSVYSIFCFHQAKTQAVKIIAETLFESRWIPQILWKSLLACSS